MELVKSRREKDKVINAVVFRCRLGGIDVDGIA
jgi:hypothetical protein